MALYAIPVNPYETYSCEITFPTTIPCHIDIKDVITTPSIDVPDKKYTVSINVFLDAHV